MICWSWSTCVDAFLLAPPPVLQRQCSGTGSACVCCAQGNVCSGGRQGRRGEEGDRKGRNGDVGRRLKWHVVA